MRINNIEFRKYKGKPLLYEIIKWYNNEYFGKEQELLKQGYIETNEHFIKDHLHIHKSCFIAPEHCYVIAFLRVNKREPDINLESVGGRILELNEQELQDFLTIYRKANKKLTKKYC